LLLTSTPTCLSTAGFGVPAIAEAKEAKPNRSNKTAAASHAEPLKLEGWPEAVPTR
jgi:hypothetical protein